MSAQIQSLFINPSTIGEDETQQLSSLYFDKNSTFSSLGLDRRLAKAAHKMNYVYPSLVQSKTIPYVLSGRDLLVRARTGTGKTAAYLFPLLHKTLPLVDQQVAVVSKTLSDSTFAIILVPTRELVDQVQQSLMQFSYYIPTLRYAALNADASNPKQLEAELQQLQLSPHFVIATPTRLLHHLKTTKKLAVKSTLKFLVLDEADLLLSYGYDQDIRDCTAFFPDHVQTLLMSATLTPELDGLKSIVTHNPAVVKLNDDLRQSTLYQFSCNILPNEKYLAFYSHFLQGMYNKKSIIFVNKIETAFKLQLFLNQFGVSTVVLNDDLPYNSRKNIILQFNKGLFTHLIATDISNSEIDLENDLSVDKMVSLSVDDELEVKQEVPTEEGVQGMKRKIQQLKELDGDDEDEDEELDIVEDDDEDGELEDEDFEFDDEDAELDEDDEELDEDDDEDDEEYEIKQDMHEDTLVKLEDGQEVGYQSHLNDLSELAPTMKARRNRAQDQQQSSSSRGLDFANVHTVVNFDLPTNPRSYTHRIGRTARAGKAGVAVTYIVDNPAQRAKYGSNSPEYVDEVALFEQMNIQRSISEGQEVVSATQQQVHPLALDENLMINLRVRVETAVAKITPLAIKNARLGAIRQELLNSERLQQHWEQHPNEVLLLKHSTGASGSKSAHSRSGGKRKIVRENRFLPDYLQTNMLDIGAAMKEAQNKRKKERALHYAKRAKQEAEKKDKDTDPLRKKKIDKNKDYRTAKGFRAKEGKKARQEAAKEAKDKKSGRPTKNKKGDDKNKRQKTGSNSRTHRTQLK